MYELGDVKQHLILKYKKDPLYTANKSNAYLHMVFIMMNYAFPKVRC